MSSALELEVLRIFSSLGKDVRMTYTTFASGNHGLEYIGAAPGIDVPTSVERWYIGKCEYNANECMTRLRMYSTQKIWDSRASYFT